MNIKNVLELDINREIVSGSPEELRRAIKSGADLRIYTEFKHNEHIDASSDNNEIIREVSDFPATYIIDDKWAAGIMTLRQPATLPDRFGERASMSFFMYNENGLQACARPFLDQNGYINQNPPFVDGGIDESKWHDFGSADKGTNAPVINFVYDFYKYKFLVNDTWEEVLSHDENGKVLSGSAQLLDKYVSEGRELKVGIEGICNGLWDEENQIKHELFIQTGPCYYYDKTGYMISETRPFVRVKPQIPMQYESHNWDFGWAIVRSDGHVAGLYYDPYTLKVKRTFSRHSMRWFVRK